MVPKCLILLLTMALTLLSTASTAMAEVVVIMRREAQSSGKYLRVSDVARVDGPRDQAKEVALVVLGPSPYRGETREITRWDIEARLFEMGIDTRVTFTGNDIVRVFGDGAPTLFSRQRDEFAFHPLNPIPGGGGDSGWDAGKRGVSDVAGIDVHRPRHPMERPGPIPYERSGPDPYGRPSLTGEAKRRVELAVSEFFAGQYKNSRSKRSDIEVEAKVLSTSDDIPYAAYDLRVAEAVDGQVPGKATLRLKVRNNENDPTREITVVADTAVYGDALVAARHITRGEQLLERDVMVTRVQMESGKGYLPPTPSAIVGRETKRSFKPGDAILAADAVTGDAVRRGSQVVVENKGKGWSVQTKGKALGGGAVGDIITVEDTGNKTKYQARIIAPGTVTAVLKRDAHGMLEEKQY